MEKQLLRPIILVIGLVLFLAGARLVCLRTARPPSQGGRASSTRFAGKGDGKRNPYLSRDREARRRLERRRKTYPPPPPATAARSFKIITEDLVMGAVGHDYRQLLQARNGSGKLSWKVSKGELPPGLTLGEKGMLSGRPEEAGEWRFTLTVKDEKGSLASREFRLLIRRNPATPEEVELSILTKTLPDGFLGKNYLQKIKLKGGTPPYRWTVGGGRLPGLIHLNQAEGVLFGIPRQAGNFRFAILVRDSRGRMTGARYILIIRDQGLKITTAALPDAFQMNKYELVLRAEGGKLPYRWKLISGELPVGIEFDPERGIISGMPENLGTAELTFSVSDAEGRTDEKHFILEIRETGFGGDALNFRITTLSLPPATRGQLYSFQIKAAGGKLPYNWTVSQGNLPPSLSLDSSSGKIEGEPEIIDPDGTVFAVLVSDQNQSTADAYYSLSVYSQLVYLTTGELDPGVAGEEYQFQLQASGGTSPYTWSLISGSLPEGLSFNSASGLIQGTISPSYLGGDTKEFTFRVKVEDQVGNYDIAELRFTVRGTFAATPTPSPTPGEGKAEISNLISGSSDQKVGLAWSNPSELTKVEVRRQTGDYPKTPYTGELVYSGSGDNFVDKNLENGITYFYAVIAYDKNNAPSPIDDNNRISATPQKVSIFGPNDPFADQVVEYRPLSSGGFGPTWTISTTTDDLQYYMVAYKESATAGPAGSDYIPVTGGAKAKVTSCSGAYCLSGLGSPDGKYKEEGEIHNSHSIYRNGIYYLYWSTYFGEDPYDTPRALGSPQGYGSYQGSLDVVSLQARINNDLGKTPPYGGTIILKFSDNMAVNEDGPDFTIFENVFYIGGDESKRFMEPAVVSVSQDGDIWYEFPFDYVPHYNDDGSPNCYNPYSYSQGFAGVHSVFSNNNSPDPTNPDAKPGGDSFDLSDITAKDLTWIQYIKITSTGDDWLIDKNGDKVRHVRDAGACSGAGSSGFDLDAVSAVRGHY